MNLGLWIYDGYCISVDNKAIQSNVLCALACVVVIFFFRLLARIQATNHKMFDRQRTAFQ